MGRNNEINGSEMIEENAKKIVFMNSNISHYSIYAVTVKKVHKP